MKGVSAKDSQALLYMGQASSILAKVESIPDAQDIGDRTRAYIAYYKAKGAKGEELKRRAEEILFRVKKRLGELSGEAMSTKERSKKARAKPRAKQVKVSTSSPMELVEGTDSKDPDHNQKGVGLSKRAKHEARRVAKMPEGAFELACAQIREGKTHMEVLNAYEQAHDLVKTSKDRVLINSLDKAAKKRLKIEGAEKAVKLEWTLLDALNDVLGSYEVPPPVRELIEQAIELLKI